MSQVSRASRIDRRSVLEVSLVPVKAVSLVLSRQPRASRPKRFCERVRTKGTISPAERSVSRVVTVRSCW